MQAKRVQNGIHDAFTLPFEPPGVAGLLRRERGRKVMPLLSIDQHPQDAIEQLAWI
jgi:hypothetical protein